MTNVFLRCGAEVFRRGASRIWNDAIQARGRKGTGESLTLQRLKNASWDEKT